MKSEHDRFFMGGQEYFVAGDGSITPVYPLVSRPTEYARKHTSKVSCDSLVSKVGWFLVEVAFFVAFAIMMYVAWGHV